MINNYEIRLKQLENIINYIKDLDNVILLGDLNDFDPNYYYVTNNTINNNLSALDILNKNNFINSYKFYKNKNIYTQYLNKKYKFLDFDDLQTLDYIFFKNDFPCISTILAILTIV